MQNKLLTITNNFHCLKINNVVSIYYSYETPVVVYLHNGNDNVWAARSVFSNTTNKHINSVVNSHAHPARCSPRMIEDLHECIFKTGIANPSTLAKKLKKIEARHEKLKPKPVKPFPIVVRICKETKQPELFHINWYIGNSRWWLEVYKTLEGIHEVSVAYFRNETRPPRTTKEKQACDAMFDHYRSLSANKIERKSRFPQSSLAKIAITEKQK